jgi:hypothetical protein
MNLSLEIPDDIALSLMASGRDLTREALELVAAEAYRENRITIPELQRLLGFETSYELDGFLKAREIWIDYPLEDAIREQRSLDRLGL